MCTESGLPDDLSWGRLGYIRWLDTAQDLCHSTTTHPLDHTDFTAAAAALATSNLFAGYATDLVGVVSGASAAAGAGGGGGTQAAVNGG